MINPTKSSWYVPILLLSLLNIANLTAAYDKNVTNAPTQDPTHNFRSLPSGQFVAGSLQHSGDTVGYVVGRFGYTDSDTLYCIAIGCNRFANPGSDDIYDPGINQMDTYRFSNSRLGIADLYLTDAPYLNNVKASELDGDGMDEIQFLKNWPTSTWDTYSAVDCHNGEWLMLTRLVSFSTNQRTDSDTTLVFFDYTETHPDSVLVMEDIFLPEEDPIIVTVPKFIPIERQSIKHRYDACHTLPDGVPVRLPVIVTCD